MKNRYIKIVSFFAVLLSVVAFSTCEVDDKVMIGLPKVITLTPLQKTETHFEVGGNVISGSGRKVKGRGVVYSTKQNPTISNPNNTICSWGSGTGEFTLTITDLQVNTTYYIRAYATNDVGTAYGEEVSFTTKEQSSTPIDGTENGYAYVDLGLSVKWATMNVGASSSLEDYGDYFAWGETTTKDTYNWSTYKWCNGSSYTLTKYCNNSSYGNNGFTDNKTQLELSDDAARANWGGSWRMPTDAEWAELINNCTWKWTTQNGAKGYKVTSKINGNSIFLLAAGYRDGSSLSYAGSNGYYLSSSLTTGDPSLALGVYFNSGYVSRYYDYRYGGLSVRPVLGESVVETTIPTVTTTIPTQITETTAVAGGNVISNGNASVTERGICIATVSNPTTSNTKITAGSGTGSFTCNLTGLQANTTYYVRAYAVNSKGTAYGEEVSFTTQQQSNTPVTPSTDVVIIFDADIDQGNASTDTYNAAAFQITKSGVTMEVSSGIIGIYNNEAHYRIFKAQTLTLTSAVGNIVKVEFTCTTNDDTKYGPGCFIVDGGKYTYSGAVGTWIGAVDAITFTASTNQVRSTQVAVTIIDNGTENGTENGYAYVDLGLSVKWATCNVGANNPEDYGDYFAWGETTTKDTYNWSTYKWCNGSSSTLTKYNTSSSYGGLDNKKQLELSDDAARANWGGSWRMPTDAEWTELREQCTWTWTTQNGVNGRKVTSKTNGKSIFLPAAGRRDDTSLDKAGSCGSYWSSSLFITDYPYIAWLVPFDSGTVGRSGGHRDEGFSVRPVCQ